MLSLSHAYYICSKADLVTRKLNYCNTILAELRAMLLSAACHSEHSSTCALPCEPAGAHYHAAHFILPASKIAD